MNQADETREQILKLQNQLVEVMEVSNLIRAQLQARDRDNKYDPPAEIFSDLEHTTSAELKSNIKRFTKDLLYYEGDKWTRSGAVNKTFVAELKRKTVESHATIQARYRDDNKLRHAARAATEIFEDLKFIINRQGGEDDHTCLEQAMEKMYTPGHLQLC
ncbi:hypothetical protein VTP01DRAFT_1182 [Rhizomucor pusillus]|uniref:uncharacterized protein n=1 Tax=Rhizomucor pusillus TaxID=4840 RepID=UPI003743A864